MRVGFGAFGVLSVRRGRRLRGVAAWGFLCWSLLPACTNEADSFHHPPSAPPAKASETSPDFRESAVEPRREYDGLTLDEWKERLKSLGPGVPGAESAIPGLRAIAEDRTVEPGFRNQVTMMLGRLGKPGLAALPTLQTLLKEPATKGGIPAVWSAKAIGLLGPGARDATPVLIEVLENPATPLEAQLACLEALARIGGHHAKAIPAVVRTLKRASERESEAGDRALLMAAVDAFYLLGPGASIAVPELMGLLDHPQELVRLKVVQALGSIGKASSPAANVLAEMLIFDESDAVRRAAAFTLASLGPEAHRLLSRFTRDEDPRVRTYTVEALGQLTPRTEELATLLVRSLDDEAADVRLAAAIALKNDESRRAAVLESFARLITAPHRSIKLSAANHLSAMQPNDSEWEKLSAELGTRLDRESRRLWDRIERMRNSGP